MKTPVTVNFPVNDFSMPDVNSRKVSTFEERFRLAILEKDFEQIHIMRRKHELKTVADEHEYWKQWVEEKNHEDIDYVRRQLEKESAN